MSAASPNLAVMIGAARKAARRLLRDFGEVENLQVSRKGAADFVSAADHAAEATLREELTRARPSYGFLGEETGETEAADGMNRFVVDPLDGTTNFLHGLPHWSISIALERRGEVVTALIYDPVRDELFTAEKGAGAWMNDRRLRVSARRRLVAAVLGCGAPVASSPELPRHLRELAAIAPQVAGLRRSGSAALDLACVAAGRLDGYWERGLNRWDVAAGGLLVREAGGMLRDLDDPKADPLRGDAILAANPDIADLLRRALAAA